MTNSRILYKWDIHSTESLILFKSIDKQIGTINLCKWEIRDSSLSLVFLFYGFAK